MITVFIKYKKLVESNHLQIDDYYIKKSEIVEVIKLTDLNNMFEYITDVKVLNQN